MTDEWCIDLACALCGHRFSATSDELEQEPCKAEGTYWFDGSALFAGIVYRFFARCDCGALVFVDDVDIPLGIRRVVSNRYLGGILEERRG